jgi:hypothetical protein
MQLGKRSGEQPRDRPGRKWRTRLLAPGLLLALALALPVAAPLLVELLAPALGAAWGLKGLSVEIDRIDWRVVTVRRIAFESGRVGLAADRGRIEYRFAELVRGRAQLLAFDRLALTVNPARPEGSDAAGPPALSVDGVARWRDALPFERAEVRELAVAVPALGFTGRGVLRLEADALELSLAGEAPAAAAGFRVDLRADRGGNAVLRLDEVRPPAPSGAVASTPRVALEITPTRGGLEIAGDVWLDGYAWDLVASVFDLAVGEGSTIGRFQIRIPGTDIGGADLRSLVATGQIQSLSWVSASGSPVC